LPAQGATKEWQSPSFLQEKIREDEKNKNKRDEVRRKSSPRVDGIETLAPKIIEITNALQCWNRDDDGDPIESEDEIVCEAW